MRSAPRSVAVLAGVLLTSAPGLLGGLEIGSVVPEFGMTTLEARNFSLTVAERTHKGVVVLFMSTICPYSNYYNDLIRDIAVDFEARGITFVGVNSGRLETSEEVRTHARAHGHTFDIIKDPGSRIAELLDARRTPEVFLLDHEGKLRYHGRIASKISSPDLKNALDSLLAGRPIRPAETKSFGCSIPRD